MAKAILILAAALLALAAAPPARAHGDPSTHYLEGDSLYPAVASRPSQAVELQLMGLLQEAGRRGYPIKVALVGTEDDLAYDLTMLRKPQRYAEFVAREIGLVTALRAPLVVITPYGVGVSGRELRGGRLYPVSRARARSLAGGLELSRAVRGDALARAAMVAVRRVARAGGRPLPAHVAPASAVWAGAQPRDSGGGSAATIDVRLLVVVFATVLPVSLLLFELWLRTSGRRKVTAEGGA